MTAFLTGFPGFLGSALTERLLARGESVTCLVQPRYREQAEARAAAIPDRVGVGDDRVTLVTGDITESALGLHDAARHREAADEVYHLAAIYDLGVERGPAERVNVGGTERVLDFAERAGVDRLHYVSTCYVSGRHDGVFGPDDLDVGQSFNNHYEATKFEAEVAVQERMDAIPTTIYRPAIAVGDSETGETDKYDGLYYLLGLLARQPRVAVAPVHPPSRGFEFNAVPRDYVVDAIAHLSDREDTANTVYQLCDPNPPTVRRLVSLCASAVGRRVLRVPIHARASRRLVESLPAVESALGVEPASLDYLSHPTRYVCPNTTQELSGTGVACPPLASYIDDLVAYMRANPSVTDDAMA
jgi:thioester reductase-like protein